MGPEALALHAAPGEISPCPQNTTVPTKTEMPLLCVCAFDFHLHLTTTLCDGQLNFHLAKREPKHFYGNYSRSLRYSVEKPGVEHGLSLHFEL